MPTLYVDASDPGAVDLPPDSTSDGTQTLLAGATLEIQQGARVVLDPSLYVLADTYTLFDYVGAAIRFVPDAPANTTTLNSYLTIDDQELRATRSLRATSLTLNPAASKITVTLVPV